MVSGRVVVYTIDIPTLSTVPTVLRYFDVKSLTYVTRSLLAVNLDSMLFVWYGWIFVVFVSLVVFLKRTMTTTSAPHII